jgi:sugar diacid utilization regulator
VVAAFDELLSSVAASRGIRSVMERTFIRELVARDPATVTPWAESLGLPFGARVSALVVDVTGDENLAGSIENAVRDIALATLRPVIVAARQGRVLALIPRVGAHDEVLDHAIDDLGDRLSGVLDHPAAVGTSSCVFSTPDDLVHALVSAGQVAERKRYNAEAEGDQAAGKQGMSARMKVPLAAGLLAAADATAILADSLLAPLLTNDSRHGSTYVQTLRTHLVLDCRMSETAEALGIHVNTLRYRLNRIESLTGRDLHVTADLVDFYLALTLRETPHHGSAVVGGNSATTR